jgi:hypothetical protein
MWGIVSQTGERKKEREKGRKKERKKERKEKKSGTCYFDTSFFFLRNTQNVGISDYNI